MGRLNEMSGTFSGKSVFGLFLILALIGYLPGAIAAIPEIPPFPVINSSNNIYHVNNVSGNDANDGSELSPWQSIKYAVSYLRAGDVLVVHGTNTPYPMAWTYLVNSGTENQWITIKGQDGINGERVIFQERLSFGDQNGPVSYIHLKNILFQGPGGSNINILIYPGSHHLAFENIEIDCQASLENERGIWTDDYAHHIWFKDMNVHRCGYKRIAPTDCGGICVKGIYVDEVVFLNVTTTDNVGDGMGGGSAKAYGHSYFKNCISERNSGDGFDIGGTRVVIVNSVARNNGGDQGAGFKLWSKESWLVSSVAYNNDNVGIMVRPRHEGDNHAYIYNTTFALNQKDRYGGQISTSSTDPEPDPTNPAYGRLFFHIHNNIFHALNTSAIVISNNTNQFISDESHNYYFSVHDGSRSPHWSYVDAVHCRNGSLVYVPECSYTFPEMADGGQWSIDTGNGTGDFGEAYEYGSGKSDLGFIDLGNGDLHLSAGSLAVDSGTDLGILFDIDGSPVPIGAAPDMGAYEFEYTDLSVTISDTPDPALLGDTVTYTVTATNTGPAPATNVTVSGTLPTCDLGTIASGASASCTPSVITGSAGTLSQSMSVTAAEYDPNSSNNTATATTTVVAPDLAPTAMSASKNGKRVNVSDTVQNQGDGAAGSLTVAYYLSTNTAYEPGTDIALASNSSGSGACTRAVITLVAGDTSSVANMICYKPTGAVKGTRYYVLVVDDSGNQVTESNEANNVRASGDQVWW